MARPSKFTRDDLLDAASGAAEEHWRDATMAHVAQRIGGPVGSIYHRFGSREELFVSLWLRAIERFHRGFLECASDVEPQEAAIAAAMHIPRFCRQHPSDAVAMTLYRHAELLEVAPASLREQVVHVNDEVHGMMRDLCLRRYGTADDEHLMLVTTACVESPYGLVRRYLRGTPVPARLDEVVRVTTEAILALGDHD